MAIINIRNEIGGLEAIDTDWDSITREWYDRMSNASSRPTFEQTAAFDEVIKSLKTNDTDMELILGKDTTGKLWYAKVTATGTTGYTDGNQHVTDMPTGWEIVASGKDGKSAYQLAVENGFSGTLAQWLLSLEGADGQDAPLPATYLYPPDAVPAGEPAWAAGSYDGQSAFYKDADANVWQYLWNGAVWQKQQGDAAIWIDGGNATTSEFSNTIDGGNASTTSFSNTIDGGNA